MGNLGGGEILVILLVALIVLGPTKLPPAVRQVGKMVGEIRRIGQGFQQELREAAQPLQETKDTLKAADKEFREVTRKPLEEMKDTLKAADLRDVGGPAAAAPVAASPAGEGSSAPDKDAAGDSDPAAATDSEGPKALASGEAADASTATSEESAEPSSDESGSGSEPSSDESGSGSGTTADESGSGSGTTADESGSAPGTAA